MLRRFARWLIEMTRPLVWRIATAYSIRVDRHCKPHGQHPLVVRDSAADARQHIPASVYFNTRSGRIEIGADTVFGEQVMVLTGKHASLKEARETGVPLHHVPASGRDIIIGRGCYIGSGAILIGPLVIGDHAVVGAGAVVTRDVPPATFVGGNPARPIARLDEPNTQSQPDE